MGIINGIKVKGVLVDRYINTAYDVVKIVSDNMDAILVVSTILADVGTVADAIDEIIVVDNSIADVNAVAALITSGDIVLAIAAPALTAADLVLTNADVVITNADAALTAADVITTNADVLLTAADVVTTNADAVLTAADLVLTNADVVLTGADVISSAASAASAAASYDSFDDRYLGSKAASPAGDLDNDGDPVIEGALYWNSVLNNMYVWNGSGWAITYSATSPGITDNAASTVLTIGFDGNVGFGVVPSAWHTTSVALQIGNSGSFSSRETSATSVLGNNMYQDSGNLDTRIVTGYAAAIDFRSDGVIDFLVSNGTAVADTALTWITALQMDTLGDATFGRKITTTGGSFGTVALGSGQMYGDAGSGLILAGHGSVNDIHVANDTGLTVFRVPTATQNVVFNGSISLATDLAVIDGGTGSSTAFDARAALGLAIGSNVQAYDSDLSTISALAKTANYFMIGNGSNWILNSPANARTALSLGALATLNSVAAGQIDANSVGASEIASSIITSAHMASNSINAFKLEALAVETAKIDNLAVTTGKIAASAVTSDKLGVNSVIPAKIQALAVTFDKIANNTITTTQMGTGSVSVDELATNAVTLTKLAANLSPWVMLSNLNASASATVDFENLLNGTYDVYKVVFTRVKAASNVVSFRMRVGIGATPTWESGAADYSYRIHSRLQETSETITTNTSTTQLLLTDRVSSATADAITGEFYIRDPSDATANSKQLLASLYHYDVDNLRHHSNVFGTSNQITAITSLRFYMSAGNITSGNFKLYGMKQGV